MVKFQPSKLAMRVRFPPPAPSHTLATPSYRQPDQRRNRRCEATKGRSWFTYILECSDGSYYVGITNDRARRLAMHNSGAASRYTRTRRPVRYRYVESRESRSAALLREIELKRWRRGKKAALFHSPRNLLNA